MNAMIGVARVRYSTGSTDTAIAGVNYDLSLNSNSTQTSTSGWLLFGDEDPTSVIVLQFINTPHNSTVVAAPLTLSFYLSQVRNRHMQ